MREVLRERARQLAATRAFFTERDVIEVDTPMLRPKAPVDAHIDLIECTMPDGTWYLHSSPEYEIKKLLSSGVGDCYQLSHVYRYGEHGALHRPEFTMIEWYRIGFTFQKMIDETVDLVHLVCGRRPTHQITYRALFLQELGVDIDNDRALLNALPQDLRHAELQSEGRDGVLNLLLGTQIEPRLGKDELTIVTHFPASQSALAKVTQLDGHPVAERFEVYGEGMELANGYHELTDAKEQRIRLDAANEKRASLGKAKYPIDDSFLAALERGLPECCGVAVGFDRLLMLRRCSDDIRKVLNYLY